MANRLDAGGFGRVAGDAATPFEPLRASLLAGAAEERGEGAAGAVLARSGGRAARAT